ncbi:MAG: hypothetical protein VX335_00725 [Pseudomonadota bacterium]|nr:hypothetical protein [Pseudomonadota bacterium]
MQNILFYIGQHDIDKLALLFSHYEGNVKFCFGFLRDIHFRGIAYNFALIKDYFSLNSARSGLKNCGKSITVETVNFQGLKSGLVYREGLANLIFQNKYSVGYIVAIPVPLLSIYSFGGDRDPLTIVNEYVRAAAALDDRFSSHLSQEEVIKMARPRLRVIIALNLKNDVFLPNQNEVMLKYKLYRHAEKINRYLQKHDYPAWVLPVLWGLESDSLGDSDLRREYLGLGEVSSKHINLPFPFASMRSHMLLSAECSHMLSSLKKSNKLVYYVTGDADYVSLFHGDSGISVLKAGEKLVSSSSSILTRFGGNNSFSCAEIVLQLKSLGVEGIDYARSVLLTQLCHSLDFAGRKLLAELDNSLAYFSETNTYIEHSLLSPDKKYCEKNPLDKLSNKSDTVNNDGGDLMSQITRIIRSQGKNESQFFQSDLESALVTSSRHELVVVMNSAAKKDVCLSAQFSSVQFLSMNSLSFDKFKQILGKLKNMQLTPSQLNSRFSNAGFNDSHDSMHKFLLGMSTRYVPYVIFFLTRSFVPKDEKSTKICRSRISTSLARCSNIDRQFKLPSRKKFSKFLAKILSLQESTDIASVSFPVAQQGVSKSSFAKKFKERSVELVKLINKFESLLRGGWFYAKSISSSDLKINVDVENLPASSSFNLKPKVFCYSETEQRCLDMLERFSIQ